MWERINEMLIKFGIAALIIAIGWLLARFIKRTIMRFASNVNDQGSLGFIASCASISIRLIFIVIGLAILGLDVSIIVGSMSAVSLGISLALQDTMKDVAGGIQILFTKPFVVGDYIKVSQNEGTVLRIEILYSVIRTPDHQDIIIPNSTIVSQVITNYSKEEYRRIHIVFPVSCETTVQEYRELGMSVIEQEERVVDTMPKEVNVDGVEDRLIRVGIYCFVPFDQYWSCYTRMNENLQIKRKEMGIPPISTTIVFKSDQEK